MHQRLRFRQIAGLASILGLLLGCRPSPHITPAPAPQSEPTLAPGLQPAPALKPSSPPVPGPQVTATPTSCTGWECTLSGVVYVGAASPGNELAGAVVHLSHSSYCSPTSGQHETLTGAKGEFEFEVYLHDTDTFRIEIVQDGYGAVQQSLGGFDCLFCSCPPFEIVVQPLGATTPAP